MRDNDSQRRAMAKDVLQRRTPSATLWPGPERAVSSPLLLVVDPSMNAWPWSAAMKLAASTLQVLQPARHLDDLGVRGTLACALGLRRVGGLVLCGEGPGEPAVGTGAPLQILLVAISDTLRSLGSLRAEPPRLEGLWFDTESRRLRTLGRDPLSSVLCAHVPPSELLEQFVRRLVSVKQR
jgi:hypothetical protein